MKEERPTTWRDYLYLFIGLIIGTLMLTVSALGFLLNEHVVDPTAPSYDLERGACVFIGVGLIFATSAFKARHFGFRVAGLILIAIGVITLAISVVV